MGGATVDPLFALRLCFANYVSTVFFMKLTAPDAKRTPVVTRQMPSSFEGVISSPKKIMPPNIDKIGVIAPKAAVCAAPNWLTA